jgi:hypothetical protein
MAAPCNWDVDPLELGICSGWNDYPIPMRDSALELATTFLWGATGRRFGVCPVTVRPSQADRGQLLYRSFPVIPGMAGLGDFSSGGPVGPFLFGGRWFNSGCASACCGSSSCAIVLRGPVASVDEVLVADEVIPASAYRVDVTMGTYLLVRVDGQCWPMCQNFTADPGEPGSFEVTYGHGTAVPASLKIAAALLACEYAKFLTGGACALPPKMTRLSRQGVEIEVAPPDPDDGKTGIKLVDDLITSLNPTGRQRPPIALSPDAPENCDRITVVPAGS